MPKMPPDPGGPLIGALLRLAHGRVAAHLAHGLAAAGDPPLHGAATQPLFDHPEGLRLTELAARAGVTKQAMAEMVEAMIAAGYVERAQDPTDGRARRLRLTRYGREVGRRVRALVLEIEARWAAQVGAARIDALLETLRAIAALPPEPVSAAAGARSGSARPRPRARPRATPHRR